MTIRVQMHAEYFCMKTAMEDWQVSLNDYSHNMGLLLFIIQKEPMISVTVVLLNIGLYNASGRHAQ
jgi:hypothetical protein